MTKDNNPVELQETELDNAAGGFFDEVEIHVANPKSPKAGRRGSVESQPARGLYDQAGDTVRT